MAENTKPLPADNSIPAEERCRTILDTITDGYYEVDLKGNLTFFNSQMAELCGCNPDEFAGMHYKEYMNEENAGKVFTVFNEVYRTGKPSKVFNYLGIMKDGSKRFIEISVSLMKNSSGEAIGFRGMGRDVTERTRFEEALQQSEERYRTILDDIPDGYYEVDLEGNYTFFSRQTAEMAGYTEDEFRGINYRKIMDKASADKFFSIFNGVYGTGKPTHSASFKAIRKDGSLLYVELSVSPIRNKNGDIAGFRGIARDVTERKEHEEKLRLSEERYRTILDTVSDSYYEVDLNGNYTFFNRQACELLGCSEEDLLGSNYRKFLDADNQEIVIEVFKEVYRKDIPSRTIHFKAKKLDGSLIYIELSISPIKNNEGAITGFRGMGHDVTERVEHEETLRQSEERYRTILDDIVDGYYEVDLQGRYTFFNRQAAGVFGYNEEDFKNVTYKELMGPEGAKTFYDIIVAVYRTGIPANIVNFKAIRKDGSDVYTEISVSPIRSKNGTITGFRGTGRDVTLRKLAEEALRQSEERYRTILDDIVDGYYEVDLKGHFTFFNRQTAELFGCPEQEFMGTSYRKFVDEDNVGVVSREFNKVYTTGIPSRTLNCKIVRKDGLSRHIEFSVSLIKNRDGGTIGFRGIVHDVTERILTEEALKQSEKWLKERNEIIERDLETAKLIQKSLISSNIPLTAKVLIDYKYLPLEAVGGDYFSFTPLQEGGLGVFIGDVSNHGVPAALFLSLIKATTDRICRKFALDPREYLKNLNTELMGNMPMSFLTCIYGVFEYQKTQDTSQVTFSFSKAGHPHPIFFNALTGDVTELNARGILIGMLDEINNEKSSAVLSKGDRIFLYTDGIPEAINQRGEMFGFEALPALIRKTGKRSLPEALDYVIAELNRFKGAASLHDDIVLIGMEIT